MGDPARLGRGILKRSALAWIGLLTIVVAVVLLVYGLTRYFDDEPVTYSDPVDHFKYGSTGGERGWKNQFGFGIPYWIWIALPELFPEYLPDGEPGRGYASFGMIYEDGKDPRFDLPIGMSMRRLQGIDRVYFNCAVCHTGVVESTGGSRQIVLGMPANTFDLGRLVAFIEASGKDWRFRPSRMLPRIEQLGDLRDHSYAGDAGYRPDEFSWLDRQIFKLVGIPMMRDQLLALLGRLDFMDFETWGPGRVDTFNSAKPILGFDMNGPHLENELVGNVDFPSVWNQRARKGMQLHWDGNNCSVDERNLSAGFGTGATPPTVDRDLLLETADYLWDKAKPPPFPAGPDRRLRWLPAVRRSTANTAGVATASATRRFASRATAATSGPSRRSRRFCTDRARLDSYTPVARARPRLDLRRLPGGGRRSLPPPTTRTSASPPKARQTTPNTDALRAQCYPARFTQFRKTYGYANAPLDGLWLRAPYLHNGSVPTLRQLLEPGERRTALFYIGYPRLRLRRTSAS